MAAEHDKRGGHGGYDKHGGHDGYDKHGGHDGYDKHGGHGGRGGRGGAAGADPLMAAITGEPLPPGARADAALLAEHRSAVADVALLREQLGIIAGALSEPSGPDRAPEPAPEPALAPAASAPAAPAPVRARPARPRPRPRRRPLALAFGALAVACAGVVVAGLGWLLVQAGGGTGDASGGSAADAGAKAETPAGSAFGGPGYLACAGLVAEGTVTAVERVPGADRYRVTLRVTRSYRPAAGDDRAVFELDGSSARLRTGDRVLVAIPRHGSVPDALFVGEREIAPERAALTAARSASPGPSCA
ncbi:hypothetical protein [Streptomyces sp. NPDC006134]|uniref:hypothetical protein n=1 Tax=Streptomyces sp. NPDC006134 TaxID=3154467 RepID=UPI0033C8AC0C